MQRFKRPFLVNLAIVLLLCTGLYVFFFTSLGWITHHGEELQIPNVIGKQMHDAVRDLEGRSFEVIVDSSYDPKVKPYTVLGQIPEVGATVKKGRTVFITVNKADPLATPMPNLIGMSYRSAEMLLKNNKLILGDTSYKPDIANGAVLSQLYKGAEIRPGQMIPQGSKVDLVLGDGLGNTQFNVPDVIGMTVDEGISMINGTGLQYTAVWDPTGITDSATAIIYNQTPKPKNELNVSNRIKAGDVMDIFIKQNPTTEEMESNRSASHGVNTGNDNNNGL